MIRGTLRGLTRLETLKGQQEKLLRRTIFSSQKDRVQQIQKVSDSEDIIIRSPYPSVKIPEITLEEFVWKDMHKWSDKVAIVSEKSFQIPSRLKMNFPIGRCSDAPKINLCWASRQLPNIGHSSSEELRPPNRRHCSSLSSKLLRLSSCCIGVLGSGNDSHHNQPDLHCRWEEKFKWK